ncbi:MAG: PKD domain-containing protein, partial [candidate division Zixibacteria bacterium]|nr:PKD domain-containing protein [candidate division Zixibacteria bacterium]
HEHHEVISNPSKGRFGAMLNHSGIALMESHTYCQHNVVANTARLPGVPLMSIVGWNRNHHFGAALTPLSDSTLLVYQVIENHPLGLVTGDLVLGYDGIPWTELYPQLLEAQLPIYDEGWWGSSTLSFAHSVMISCGANWHLYDTIDIVKYESGDTMHLPTGLLAGENMVCYGTEMILPTGIPTPDWNHPVSWGMIQGTHIGYVTSLVWLEPSGVEFFNAIDSLMFHHETIGLIIDCRFNYGGSIFEAYPAMELLFNSYTETVGFGQRCEPNIRDSLCVIFPPINYAINADPNTYYDRPIALLCGPGGVSAGDQTPLALSLHPEARTFGKPTAAAFNAATQFSPGNGYTMQHSIGDAYLASNPGHYLTHDPLPLIDVDVWLTQEGVAAGEDNVINSAIQWIHDETPVWFFADSSFGQAPLDVAFNGWSPGSVDAWVWEFGDGDSGFVVAPMHTYTERGIYDVTVTADIDGQMHGYTDTAAIVVLADTLVTDTVTVTATDSTVEVHIFATNTIPLNRLTIPLEYAGAVGLVYDSFSTAGCRTEYFGSQSQIHYSPAGKRTTIKMQTTVHWSQHDLSPGTGEVLTIYLHIEGNASPGQQTILSLDGYTGHEPVFARSQTEYLALGVDGLVAYTTCCRGIRGNVDDDSSDAIDIADLVYLVDYMFAQGVQPPCGYEANVDADIFKRVDISDLVYLVDYMFTGGPPPPDCP